MLCLKEQWQTDSRVGWRKQIKGRLIWVCASCDSKGAWLFWRQTGLGGGRGAACLQEPATVCVCFRKASGEWHTSLCQFSLQASHNGDKRNNQAFFNLSVFPLNSQQHLVYTCFLYMLGCKATVKDCKIAHRLIGSSCTVFYWGSRCPFNTSGLSKLKPHVCLSYISNITVSALTQETNLCLHLCCLSKPLETQKALLLMFKWDFWKKPRQEGADPYDFHTCLLLLLCPAEGYFDMIDIVKLKSIFLRYLSLWFLSSTVSLRVYHLFTAWRHKQEKKKRSVEMVFSLRCKSSSGIDQMFKSQVKSPERYLNEMECFKNSTGRRITVRLSSVKYLHDYISVLPQCSLKLTCL